MASLPVTGWPAETTTGLREAGVRVRLVTADPLAAARRGAAAGGLLTTQGLAVEAATLRQLSQAEATVLLPHLQVSLSTTLCAMQDALSSGGCGLRAGGRGQPGAPAAVPGGGGGSGGAGWGARGSHALRRCGAGSATGCVWW